MEVRVEGDVGPGVSAKDIILHITGVIGAAGGTGHVIEYTGSAIRALSVEGRLTVSNMAIEGGARAGLIAPDETTFAYLKGRSEAHTSELQSLMRISSDVFCLKKNNNPTSVTP